MEAHEIPESIQWHEGLMLTPQHFQQLSLRHESLLQYVAGAIAPFNWGVRRFEWNAADLAAGKLSVLRLDAVMPDGLVVSYGWRGGRELGADDLSLDLSAHAERLKGGGGVTVYLAVTTRDKEKGTRGRDADGRYLSVDGDPVADEEAGGSALVIHRLRPRLKLFAGDAPGKDHVSFPLARVRRTDASFTLEGFIPPALAVASAPALARMCSDAVGHMREKAMFLADRLRGPAGGVIAAIDRETEALVRCIVAPLPQLEAVLSAGVTHPFAVYLAFCGAAGQVSTLGGRLDPPLFRPYDHNDLAATFGQVLDYIRGRVEAAASSSFTIHAFTYEDGVFRIDFDPAWTTKRLVLGMRARAGMTEADLSRWGMECVIGSASLMESLRRNRVRGARRSLIERDEDLVPPRDVLLFALAPDPEFVEPGEVLQIFNTTEHGHETRPSAIVLYVRHTG